MPVDITLEPPKDRPQVIQPERFYWQAKVDKTERWRSPHRFDGMTPATLNSILQEAGERGKMGRWGDLCEYMLERDAELASVLNTRIDRVVQAPYKIRPPKTGDAGTAEYAEPAARFCKAVTDNLDGSQDPLVSGWDALLGELLTAIGVGFSAREFIWERNLELNAQVVSGFRFAHPHRFHLGEGYDLRLYDEGRKDANEWGEALLENNWIVHFAETRGAYPSKAGILRSCAWPWLLKQWFTKFYAHGVEVYGSPFIAAKVPDDAKDGVMNEVLTGLKNMTYDTVGAFKGATDIVFHNVGGGIGDGSVYSNAIETLCNSAYSKLILGASDITDPGVHGSQSAVESRIEVTLDPRTIADGKRLAADVRQYLFTPLCELNDHLFGYKPPPIPEMSFGGDAEEERMVPEVQAPEAAPEAAAKKPDATVPEPETASPTGSPQDSTAAEAAQGGDKVADVSMTGVQIEKMVEVVKAVAAGEIPRASGIEVLLTAFPIDRAKAEAIMGEVGKSFQPKADQPPEPPPPAEVPTMTAEEPPPKASAGLTPARTSPTSSPSVNPIAKALLGE